MPTLWLSLWLGLLRGLLQLPLNLLKWLIRALHTPAKERARAKRTVLISGGSTVQAVKLAQNFYSAGARVVVCELEGLFGLARFSTACARYYEGLPRPRPGAVAEYVHALKSIVRRERAVYYIPVSATSSAYYDALAKPHLEALGCECFVPAAGQVAGLDDPLELVRRCAGLGLPRDPPATRLLRVGGAFADVERFYEELGGDLGRRRRHYLVAPAGPAACLAGPPGKLAPLPKSAGEFRRLVRAQAVQVYSFSAILGLVSNVV